MGGWKRGGRSRAAALVAALACGAIAIPAALGGSVTPGQINWGGYTALVAQSQTFKSVTSTFTIPQLDCSGTAGQQAGGTLLELWSGLDGAYPGAPVSVEQVGVEPSCHLGAQVNPTAYALQWVNKKGKIVHVVGQVVLNGTYDLATGDSVTATVSHSGTLVTVTLRDNSTGSTGSVSATCPKKGCAYKSAEAIIEAPGPIASFATVSFTASSATDSLGHTGGLVTSGPWWNTEQLTLIGTDAHGNRFTPCATPGPYDAAAGAFTMTGTGRCVTGS